jgi:hypothetical protein
MGIRSSPWLGQILGFCGLKPIRIVKLGPTSHGGVEKSTAAAVQRPADRGVGRVAQARHE